MTFYYLAEFERTGVSPNDSAEERPTIRGDRIEVSYYRYPAGTVKKPHTHPEEQIIIVLKGSMGYRVKGQEKILGPGEVVRIPANEEHDNWALDEEVEFISCKDLAG